MSKEIKQVPLFPIEFKRIVIHNNTIWMPANTVQLYVACGSGSDSMFYPDIYRHDTKFAMILQEANTNPQDIQSIPNVQHVGVLYVDGTDPMFCVACSMDDGYGYIHSVSPVVYDDIANLARKYDLYASIKSRSWFSCSKPVFMKYSEYVI